jgi:hypothetical protein
MRRVLRHWCWRARHIAEWEEEMLAHGRIDFDTHMSSFTEKRF